MIHCLLQGVVDRTCCCWLFPGFVAALGLIACPGPAGWLKCYGLPRLSLLRGVSGRILQACDHLYRF